MLQRWSLPSLIAIYFLAAGSLFVCGGVSIALVMKAATGLSQNAEREKTLLDLRIESAREIKRALAKPVAQPEPLPLITAKLARPLAPLAPIMVVKARPKPSKDALNAFASSDISPRQAMAFDRHASNF